MPDLQIHELRQTTSLFKSVLAAHTAARERLIERRANEFRAEQLAMLDERIASNERTIETVKRAIESLEGLLWHVPASELVTH